MNDGVKKDCPAVRQLEAYNNRDIDAFMACYTKDCRVEDAEGNLLMQGAEAMRARYDSLFKESPELHCKLVSRVYVGDYVLDEENVTGSRGSTQMSHVVAIYHVKDGLIDHVRFIR